MAELCDLQPWYLVCRLTLTLVRLELYLKVVGQMSRSNAKNRILHHCYLASRSMSKVGVKVKVIGQGQRQGQFSGVRQSILGARLCRVQLRAIRAITRLRCLSVCL